MRRRHATGLAGANGVVSHLALFTEHGGHGKLCLLDRSLRDGRPLFLFPKGNPYISANRATINAEKAPSDRQSRVVLGRVKLNAKRIKKTELTRTNHHTP